MDTIEYDDRNLQQMFAEMTTRRRSQAIRGGFRKAAAAVRRKAVANLRGCVRSNRKLEKGIRSELTKRGAGFRVTVASKKGKNMYTNRRGKTKPVLVWMEGGTKERKTRLSTKRKSHATGRMKRYGFMEKTLNEVRPTITSMVQGMVIDNVKRIAKKYGCE